MSGGERSRRWTAPLWWAEVKAGRYALGLVALLAAGTAAAAAVVPAKVAYADQAVTDDAVAHASFAQRDMIQRESVDAGSVAPSNADLVNRGGQALRSMPEPIRRIVPETDVSVLSTALLPTGGPDPATGELPPFYRLADLPDYQKKVTFVAGAPPLASQRSEGPDRTVVPVAVGREVAARFHLSVGSTITSARRGTTRESVVVLTVTGIFTPGGSRGEADPAWNIARRVFQPERTMICPTGEFGCESPAPSWLADALVPDAGSITRLTAATTTWDHVVESARVRSADLTAVSDAVRRVQQGRVTLGGDAGVLSTGMLGLIAQIRDTQWTGHLVAAVVLGGAAAGGLAALLLVLGMAIGRRSRELALMKARGAGPGRLAVRIAAQVAVVALSAGVAGATLGAAAAGGSLSAATTWYGAAGVTVAAFAVVTRLVWRHTDHVVARRGGETGDAATRKVVRDVGVVLAAAGALAVYRFGGSGGSGTGSIDPLAVAAPALAALAAGVVAVRLMPALLNPVARIAGRGRGSVGFVGAALAGRRVRAVAAPLVGSVVVVAAGMLAAGYDASVATKVRVDAFDTVGSGARVVAGSRLGADEKADPTGTAMADGFVAEAARLPGAQHATGAWLGMATLDVGGNAGWRVELVVVDADSFRAVADDTAAALPGQVGSVPASWPLASGSAGPSADSTASPSAVSSAVASPASALASPGLPCAAGSGVTLQVGGYTFAARCDGTAEVPMAVSEQDRYAAGGYVIVPRTQLRDAVTAVGTATPIETMTRPNTVWISGAVTGSALRALPGVTSGYRIDLVQDVRAAKSAAGQTKSAREVFHVVEALCVGYFALCLVLLLAATGRVSRDSALLMQVLGLRPGRSRLVSVLVPAPIAAVALAVGVGMGLGLAPLLGPLTRSTAGVAGPGSAARGSVLATSSIGLSWAVPVVAVAVLLAAAGIALDLLLRRDRDLSVRLRSSDYE